jgi:hypothetical protein
MPTKSSPSVASKPNKPQLDKFKEAARELECDDDERRFKERLGKLVKQRPHQKGEPHDE